MARMSKDERHQTLHAECLKEFDLIQSTVEDEREQCLLDRRFYSIAGGQWEGSLADQFANKPKLEVNKVHLALIRIFNEYRNNRITVDFVSKEGVKTDKLADTCDGLYRSDEEYSNANEAYDNAFEEAVGGGFGAWRLRAEYEDDEDPENEYQRICIEPIYDADSCVFFDTDAKRQDKRDAKSCYVLTSMSLDAYKAEFGDDPRSWPKSVTSGTAYDWVDEDKVWIAEVYKVESKRDVKNIYKRLDGSEISYMQSELREEPEIEETLLASGAVLDRSKPIKTTRVHKYLMSGGRILDDMGYIAGKNIPIVPVYGKRWYVDGVERCMGHVRLAKDAQRLKNMQLSKLAEISALSGVSKPIFHPEQITGNEAMWSQDNIKNYPYLLINPITDLDGNPVPAGAIGYTKAPEIPPAMAALLAITEQDMQDLLGNQQAGEQLAPNISGKVVELVQNRLDMQVFIYMSNMSKAMRRCGEIWLSMARELYIEPGRKMKIVHDDDAVGSVELQQEVYENGTLEYANDMGEASYDVVVDVGPSSSSKRASTVRALTAMMQITADPETIQVLGSMAMMNMEGEGISEVRDFFRRRLINMQVIKPTEEEAAELMAEAQNAQPDANTAYLTAAAENEAAKAQKAKADTFLTLAKTEQAKAETLKTMGDLDSQSQADTINAMKALEEAAGALGNSGTEQMV